MSIRNTKRSLRRLATRMAHRCGLKFHRDEDGVVAVEFALIMPIMLIMYLGMFQISMVIIQDRHVSHAASVMGDLATQGLSVNQREAANILQAGIAVLQVTNDDVIANGDVDLQLISVQMESDGTVTEIGRVQTSTDFADMDYTQINPRLLSQTSGAVIARVRYQYKFLSTGSGTNAPFKGSWVGGQPTLEETFILKPRLSSVLPFEAENDSSDSDFDCTFQPGGKVLCDGVSATPPATSGGGTTSLG